MHKVLYPILCCVCCVKWKPIQRQNQLYSDDYRNTVLRHSFVISLYRIQTYGSCVSNFVIWQCTKCYILHCLCYAKWKPIRDKINHILVITEVLYCTKTLVIISLYRIQTIPTLYWWLRKYHGCGFSWDPAGACNIRMYLLRPARGMFVSPDWMASKSASWMNIYCSSVCNKKKYKCYGTQRGKIIIAMNITHTVVLHN